MKLDACKASLKGEDEEAPQESISFLARNFDGTMRSFNQKPNWASDSPRGNDRRFDSGKVKTNLILMKIQMQMQESQVMRLILLMQSFAVHIDRAATVTPTDFDSDHEKECTIEDLINRQ